MENNIECACGASFNAKFYVHCPSCGAALPIPNKYEKRMQAMKWWNELLQPDKQKHCTEMFKERDWMTLTGREIEMIYSEKEG